MEAKWGDQNTTNSTPQQMSVAWINSPNPQNNPNGLSRIQWAVGSISLGNQIMNSNPTKLLANVSANGSVIYYILDDNGLKTGATFNP